MKITMNNSSVMRMFIEWLECNQLYFKHKLEMKCKRRNYFEFKYCGIIPEIMPIIKADGIEVIILINNKVWDRLCWLDGIISCKNKSGKFYDKSGIPKERNYYNSLKSLFFSECFEPFMEWSNENILSDNSLLHWKVKSGGGGSIITNKNNIPLIKNKMKNKIFKIQLLENMER